MITCTMQAETASQVSQEQRSSTSSPTARSIECAIAMAQRERLQR